jgi:4-hydroxy-tetrahydrodipicolinate synthase
MEIFQGVYVVTVTPFTATGEVDLAGVRKNAEWLIARGVDGLIPLGSTGEFASLSEEQKAAIAAVVLETAAGRVPVVVGAAAETTDRALATARSAERAGAAGVLVLPPWYYTPDQEELFVHYRRIAEGISIPLMIYNNPASSKVDVKAATVARLARLPNIRAIKESTGDIRRISEIRELTDDSLTICCGWEDMAFESFVLGARGWVCVIGNVFPEAARELYELAVCKRDIATAWRLYRRMLPLLRLLEYAGKTQKILKYVMDGMGLAGGCSSSPKLPPGDEDKALVDRLVRDFRAG